MGELVRSGLWGFYALSRVQGSQAVDKESPSNKAHLEIPTRDAMTLVPFGLHISAISLISAEWAWTLEVCRV